MNFVVARNPDRTPGCRTSSGLAIDLVLERSLGLVAADLRLELQMGDDSVEHRLRHQGSTGVIEVGDPAHAWRVTPGSLDVDQSSIPPP